MLTWTLVVAVAVGAPALKPGRSPSDAPAGDWVVESTECDGVPSVPTGTKSRYGVRIGAGRVTLLRLGPGGAADPGESQPAVFYAPAGGRKAEADVYPDDSKRLQKAIWKVDGDTLTVCEAAPGDDRPSEFTAPKGSRRTLWVAKRIPKK
jgi:hypothetical protein